jgi:hypothetical protein
VWGTSEKPCMSGTYCPRGTSEPIPCADGATCFVPASPELVLAPDMFDLLESEVGGSIQYQLSLSTQPYASVIVKIEVIIESVNCYAYDESSKFQLDRMEFEFVPDNYNIPQIVVSHFHFLHNHFFFLTITFFFSLFFPQTCPFFYNHFFHNHFFQNVKVNRLNASRYEGTHSAIFQHSIETEGEDFSAAFLRPVLLTLEDDSECAYNARKIENKITRVRSCGCMDGYYIIDTDPKYCNSVIECGVCPNWMICTSASNPSGQILEDALILEGWHEKTPFLQSSYVTNVFIVMHYCTSFLSIKCYLFYLQFALSLSLRHKETLQRKTLSLLLLVPLLGVL